MIKPKCTNCNGVLCINAECYFLVKAAMNNTRTQWFTKYQPKHIGVYEVSELYAGKDLKGKDVYLDVKFSYWDGRKFCYPSASLLMAFHHRLIKSRFLPLAWRGLAEKPKGK